MAGPTLPPRAYTKDVLAQAFEWLKKQPASIRELATSADNLVSLYETAMRRSSGADKPEGSPSSQAFKTDLRNIAQDLKNFEEPQLSMNLAANQAPSPPEIPPAPRRKMQPPPVETPAPSAPEQTPAPAAPMVATPVVTKRPPKSFLNQFSEQLAAATTPPPLILKDPEVVRAETAVTAKPLPKPIAPPVEEMLDARTHEIVKTVRERLNLSSDQEAMRMLITMGYDRLRDVLPR